MYKQTIIFILLTITVQNQGGLIGSLFEKVTNTTHAITSGVKSDIRNVVHIGKSIVGLEKPLTPEERQQGLVGGMVNSVHEKFHRIKEHYNSPDISNNEGLVSKVYNSVKAKISKIKGLFLDNPEHNPVDAQTPSEDHKVIREALEKLFFKNGTRSAHGKAFQEAIENLRRKLKDIRNNTTQTTTTSPTFDGSGMLDIRYGTVNSNEGDDNMAGAANDIFDSVNDDVNKVPTN